MTNIVRHEEPNIADLAKRRVEQRGLRRAAALNVVNTARAHAGKTDSDPFTQQEADVIMAIMELLDRVADS